MNPKDLENLLTQMPAAIAVIRGPELRYELSNPLNTALAGGRPLNGRTIYEAWPEFEAQGLTALVKRVYETGEPFVGKEVFVQVDQPDGSKKGFYLNGMYQPLTGPDGKVNGVLAFAYDVTEHVEARKGVALIADSVPQIIWTSDAQGRIEFFNRRWYEFTGLPQGSLPMELWSRVCHPDDLPRISPAWAQAAAAGTTFEGEIRLKRAVDQTWRWHLFRVVPLRDESGRLVRFVGSSTDIDDRKKHEQLTHFMSESSQLLGASLDPEQTLKSLVTLVVPRLADWCDILLLEEGESVPRQLAVAHVDPEKVKWGVELTKKYPPDPRATTGVMQVIRTGKPELVPVITEPMLAEGIKDPEYLRLLLGLGLKSLMLVPLSARGKTFGCMSFVMAESGRVYGESELEWAMDLAQRAAAAVDNARLFKEAQDAIKVRDEFLSVASHELKTPLTPLQLQVQGLLRSLSPSADPKLSGRLDTISRQVTRLQKLVDNLLDISRITGGRLDLEREQFDLAALVTESCDHFKAELGDRAAGLQLQVSGPVIGTWDKLRVEQIVTNLLTNAAKFGEGKPIEVRVEARGDHAWLTVRDHGIGIAPEDQARIFKRFERAVPAQRYGGFGLGLWIVRQIVEGLGGVIQVESVVGKGSTFSVVLPLGA